MSDELEPGLRPRERDDGTPSNVLILAPAERAPTLCSEHLFRGGGDDLATVKIEFSGPSVDLASTLSDGESEWPAALEVISVEGAPHGDDESAISEVAPADVTVEHVDYRRDLALVGIEVAETLRTWQDSYDDVALCVDSLTTLVHLAGADRAYRFLHVLAEDVRRSDVRAHYHLDPNEHDLQTTYLLETLADAFVVSGDVDIDPPRD